MTVADLIKLLQLEPPENECKFSFVIVGDRNDYYTSKGCYVASAGGVTEINLEYPE